jgi:hypothetical protein
MFNSIKILLLEAAHSASSEQSVAEHRPELQEAGTLSFLMDGAEKQ